ncbi:MAG TPA: hypothetical protein VKM55_15090 [Candidatus Lokiarchaeia archaeon]|nr:hypothetical protein [Candidatus Lokiarchaeia archaeon]
MSSSISRGRRCANPDPIIHGDLTYYYHFIQKDPTFDFEHGEPEKIARDMLVHVKKGLESLEQIIPGTKFNPDSF